MAGKLPKTISRLRELADACGCHPSEFLTPSSRSVYEMLLYEADQLFMNDIAIEDQSLHMVRVSREIRQWEKFFEGVGRDDSPDERSEEIDSAAGSLFRPPDVED